MAKKAAFYTLGCKLNYSETSTISGQFVKEGFDVVDFDSHADVYVINTCTVTENAEKDCRHIVRKALRNNPDAFVAVVGCYAQLRPEQIVKIPGVDVVLGSKEKFDIFSLLDNFEKKELSCIFVSPVESLNNDFHIAFSSDGDARTRAFLKIQDGCDYTCSYCTIPLARGKSRSSQPDEAISRFRHLVESGYKEIILTGVNVGDYGNRIGTDFFQLLRKLVDIDGDFRIRISSIEPNLLEDNILELIAGSDKMCKHVHIPLQSGSDKVLRLMQRRYTTDFYRSLIGKVKERIPDAGIGVDVIVGSPGESAEDFVTTHKFLAELPVSYLHVFTYSERPGTKALTIPGMVDVFERKERNRKLHILSDMKRNDYFRSMVGKKLDVLFEHQNENGLIKGFSSNYVRVAQAFDESLVNTIVPVEIKGTDGHLCFTTKVE
jgi:threonylcarbamoyladenosine tRNA methylthiotransferase MtaB